MTTAAAPAPAAPAAKPAASPASDAPIAPIQSPIDYGADIDNELASLDDDRPQKKVEKPRETTKPKPPEKEQTDDENINGEIDNLEDGKKEVEKTKEPDKTKEPEKPVKAADLRTAYDGLKKRVREEFEPQIAQLQAKLKEFESKPKEDTAIIEELKTVKQRRDELEQEIKFVNFKKSSEFREKYEKPYEEAWKKAMSDLSELTVPTDDGGSREATTQDLLMLANMKLGEARAKAREMFGDAADDVMVHRRIIRELSDAQTKALEDAKTNSGEYEKKLATQRQIEYQEKLKLWKTTNEELSKKYPKWFAEVEGDDEGNTLLRKGFALADLHFTSAKGLTPEQVEALPPKFRDAIKAKGDLDVKDQIALDALLRHKIASHSKLASSLKKAHSRIAELEKTVAEYEKSEPPAGSGKSKSGAASASPVDEAMAELEAIDQRNR